MCGLSQKAGNFPRFTEILGYVGVGDETIVLVFSGKEQSIGLTGNVMRIKERKIMIPSG